MRKTYFEVTYRGVHAAVEVANGLNRWEILLDDGYGTGGDWTSLGVGDYPAVSVDQARKAAVEYCKSRRPSILAGLYRERERIQAQITALEAP